MTQIWRRFWSRWRDERVLAGLAFLVLIPAAVAAGGASCTVSVEFGGGSGELDEDDIDENIRSFVDDAIVSVFSPPSSEALLSRSAPELAAIENMDRFFDDLTGKTGALEEYEITDVQVVEADVLETGDPVRVALYRADAVFENGPGVVELDVIKRDGDLQIVRWFIGGPVVPQ